ARLARPLVGKNVALWAGGGAVSEELIAGLTSAGAQVLAAAQDGGTTLDALELDGDERLDALVFDAREFDSAEALRGLYDFFHPLMGRIPDGARLSVVGRPPELQKSAVASAAQAALEGFSRSLAKEVARSGSTANLIYVEAGAAQ